MSDTAVDSSVAAKWILPESDSSQAFRLITNVAMAGERLFVLDLAIVEITNAIWKRVHQRLVSLAEAFQFLEELQRSPVHIEAANRLLRPALEIAVKYGRSIYDSVFVALAQDLGLVGVTADEPLYHSVHTDFPMIVLLRDWKP